MDGQVCLCVSAHADCGGHLSCHQPAVKMTIDYWGAVNQLTCGTSKITFNFLTITFRLDSNFAGLGLSDMSQFYGSAE